MHACRRLGSSSCVAPEVLNGEPRDFQSDLFSVGILAYILLTGHHPFLHKSGLISIPDLIRGSYIPPRLTEIVNDIPEKYDKIVMRLLEKDSKKRFQRAREVLDVWREKIDISQCPRCNAENPPSSKFCGQCGSAIVELREGGPAIEKDLNMSFVLFNAGRPQEAIKLMKNSLDKNTDHARGWAHLGYMLNHERRYEEADEACTKSINIDSRSSNPFWTRGFAKSNLGKFPEAIEDFTTAVLKEPDDTKKSLILRQRGYAKKLSGDYKGALEDATNACMLDATNSKAQGLKEELESIVGVLEGYIDYIEGVQAYLFFPKDTPKEKRNLEYHKRNLIHRLIINFKTQPATAYFLTPDSFGWRFIEKYPERWVHEIVPPKNYEIDDPSFTDRWCTSKGYRLLPWTAEKKELQKSG